MDNQVIVIGCSGVNRARLQELVDKFNCAANTNITIEEFEDHLSKLRQPEPLNLDNIEITEMEIKSSRFKLPFPDKEHRGKHRTHRNKWRR